MQVFGKSWFYSQVIGLPCFLVLFCLTWSNKFKRHFSGNVIFFSQIRVLVTKNVKNTQNTRIWYRCFLSQLRMLFMSFNILVSKKLFHIQEFFRCLPRGSCETIKHSLYTFLVMSFRFPNIGFFACKTMKKTRF